jgi:hypothetical protein
LVWPKLPYRPDDEVVITMRPYFCARMIGHTAWVQ